MRVRLLIIALGTSILTQVAWGWGREGHKLVSLVGGELLAQRIPFWAQNAQNLSTLSLVPDENWKRKPMADIEKPTHYFEPDGYYSNPQDFAKIPSKYSEATQLRGEAFVVQHGTAWWRVQQFFLLAETALRGGQFQSAVEMAGVMSHYVGDLSQPLHVTVNYDGQLTGQDGIHKHFETTIIEDAGTKAIIGDLQKRAQKYHQDYIRSGALNLSVSDLVFAEIERSYSYRDRLLQLDQQLGRGGKGSTQLLDMAIDRMADGAAVLAILLEKISMQSGNPGGGVSLKVKRPQWVEPDYSVQRFTPMVSKFELEDDCHH